MKVFSIEDKLFKTEPLFIGNCTFRQADQYLHRRFRIKTNPKDLGELYAGTVLSFDHVPWIVVWIKRMNKGTDALGVAMHEIFHLVIRICEDKGLPIMANDSNGDVLDEAPAYMMEFFVKQYLSKL